MKTLQVPHVGHTIKFGATGAGKSTHLASLVAQLRLKWVLLSILLFLAFSPSLALAAGTGGGGGLPWETPLQNVQQSLTGPVAKGVALVAIVGALGTMLFLHAEMNAFTRVVVFVVLGIGTLVGANAFLTGSGAQGAEVTGTSKTSIESYASHRAQYPDPSGR
jgi:type IV secretory pathway VirB2 component (pilin)